MYKLHVETSVALRNKIGGEKSRDVGELWHTFMGYLHNEVLKILQQIKTGLTVSSFD